jgi:phage terminase small subunit
MELDPKYVGVIVGRWAAFTRGQATLESDGRTFAEMAAERLKVGRVACEAANRSFNAAQAARKPAQGGDAKLEPKPDGDLSDAPDWLNEAQQTCWRCASSNRPRGMLKRIDLGVLVAWSIAEDLHRQAAEAQAKVGLLVRIKTRATIGQDDPGVPAASPYINILNQQAKIMLKAASELGFTQVSRPRVYGGPSVPGPNFGVNSAATTEDHMSLDEYLTSAPKVPIVH